MEEKKEIRDNSLLESEDDLKTYRGIKTHLNGSCEEEEEEEKESSANSESDKGLYKEEQNNDKVPVTFEWDQGGNCVYVTGNFCNWNQFFLMQKNAQGLHYLTLRIAKGYILYKFKVDDEWKCNEKYPTCTDDDGNLNNYLDSSKWQISVEKSNENTDNSTTENSNNPSHKQNRKSSGQSEELSNAFQHYTLYIPAKNELNVNPPKIVEQYLPNLCLDINSKQIVLENKIDYLSEEKNLLSENYSYKEIKLLPHEQISHLIFHKNNIDDDENINKKPIINSVVSRYRLKFSTFVYYK